VSWLEFDTNNAPAPGLDDVAADDGVGGPIVAFDQDVGLQDLKQVMRRGIIENDDAVYAGEPLEDFRTLRLGGNRSAGPLDLPNRAVGVEADDQRVPEPSRVLEIAQVADVKEVENTVGEDDRTCRSAQASDQLARLLGGQRSSPTLNTTFGVNVQRWRGR
jgi:hypothetical protein